MKTGLSIILSSIILCVITTLFISINFIYDDAFKVKYKNIKEVSNIESFQTKIDYNGNTETINASIYKSHLGFQINYDVDKFDVSLKSNSSVYFYYIDNKEVYLKIEKMNKKEYYESYNNDNHEYSINGYNYNYKYLKNNKSYYKLTIKNLDSNNNTNLDARFSYMIETFYILN